MKPTEAAVPKLPSINEEEHRRQGGARLQQVEVWPKADQTIAKTAKEVSKALS